MFASCFLPAAPVTVLQWDAWEYIFSRCWQQCPMLAKGLGLGTSKAGDRMVLSWLLLVIDQKAQRHNNCVSSLGVNIQFVFRTSAIIAV
jgi:hypothetical protein